jgi:hypothetical protein
MITLVRTGFLLCVGLCALFMTVEPKRGVSLVPSAHAQFIRNLFAICAEQHCLTASSSRTVASMRLQSTSRRIIEDDCLR